MGDVGSAQFLVFWVWIGGGAGIGFSSNRTKVGFFVLGCNFFQWDFSLKFAVWGKKAYKSKTFFDILCHNLPDSKNNPNKCLTNSICIVTNHNSSQHKQELFMKNTKNTEKTKKVKNQEYRSLWTTVLKKDINETSLPSKEIDKTIKYIKDNNIDIYKIPPEVEELLKIFRPKY